MSKALFMLALPLASVVPMGAQSVAPAEATMVRHEVREFMRAFRETSNAFDLDGLAALYSRSSNFRWIEPGRWAYESRADLTVALAQLEANFDVMNFSLDDLRIVPLSRQAAAVSFRFRETLASRAAPDDAFSFSGEVLAVLVREGETWRFLLGHSSSPTPPSNQ